MCNQVVKDDKIIDIFHDGKIISDILQISRIFESQLNTYHCDNNNCFKAFIKVTLIYEINLLISKDSSAQRNDEYPYFKVFNFFLEKHSKYQTSQIYSEKINLKFLKTYLQVKKRQKLTGLEGNKRIQLFVLKLLIYFLKFFRKPSKRFLEEINSFNKKLNFNNFLKNTKISS